MRNRRRPPPKRGPSLLPDSLIARASFTHGFPHYPNPNLPMALRPVVNRCANSIDRIDRLFPLDKGFVGLDSFTSQSASADRARFQREYVVPAAQQCGGSYAAPSALFRLLSDVVTRMPASGGRFSVGDRQQWIEIPRTSRVVVKPRERRF